MKKALLKTNPSWSFHRIEAPVLNPAEIISSNYSNEDVFFQSDCDLVLRPETTPSTYAYIQNLQKHEINKPPICVYQSGKSFRREQDQTLKHMRLKEFYQLEFQCLFSKDSGNDYHSIMIEPVHNIIKNILKMETRVVDSDRLPSYSLVTKDIEVKTPFKWMEVCSISLRNDYPEKWKLSTKNGIKIFDVNVLEIAIGLDRLVYNNTQETP